MRHNSRFLIFLVTVVIFAGCDKGTDPPPVEHGPYAFYMNDPVHPNCIYEYWPASDSLDTLIVDMTGTGSIAVSPDGKLLYLGTRTETAVVDLTNDSVVSRLPYISYGGIAASPDGRLIALAGEGFWLLDAYTYEVLYEDTGSFAAPVFDPDHEQLLTLKESKGILVLQLGDPGSTVKYVSFDPAAVTRVIPIPRIDFWAVYVSNSSTSHNVLVYSPLEDSVYHSEFSSTGYGDLCADPAGHYIYYSAPGTLFSGPPEPFIVEIDLRMGFARAEIATTGIYDQNGTLDPQFLVAYLAMTPDGDFLGGTRRLPSGSFLVLDRKLREFSAYYNLSIQPNFARIYRIAVQSNL